MTQTSNAARTALTEARYSFWALFKLTLPIALLWLLIFETPMSYVENWALTLPATSSDALVAKIAMAGVNGLWSFLELLLVAHFCRLFHKPAGSPKTLAEFLWKNTYQYFLESTRAFSHILLWYLLFIIPGIIRQSQWALVPFVVFFDEVYDRGDVDVLKRSRQLVDGFIGWFLGILALQAVLGIVLELYKPQFESYIATLVLNLLLGLFGFAVSVFVYNFMYLFFSQRLKHVRETLPEGASA